ncbi:MAG TPA: hypothetical protein VI895_14055 [Bdellovibrionota bacterium]|nr:hypothetical protein [Bdellovibrionota bacterium]
MSRYYARSQKMYEGSITFDDRLLLEAMKRISKGRRKPTSVALEEPVIQKLKRIAERKGISYQVLMRMFILDGLRRLEAMA